MASDSDLLVPLAEGFSWEEKKLLVIVNPFGGSGTGSTIWSIDVEPVFLANKISYELLETTHGGHAAEHLRDLKEELYQYFGIVTIGGDGTMHEVLNALYKRPDSERAVSIPLAIVPGGTGNGLAISLGYRNARSAALGIARGVITPLDLTRVRIGENIDRLSSLSIAWGLVADHDMLSERDLRWMGAVRLVVIPVFVILRCRSYWGKLSFLPYDSPKKEGGEGEGEGEEWKHIDSNVVCMVACNVPWLAGDVCFAPKANANDGSIDLVLIQSHLSRYKIFQLFNQTSTKDRPEDPDVGYYKVRSFKIEPNETEPGSWVVDGEAMDEYKTLRADVLPGRGRFFYSSATAN